MDTKRCSRCRETFLSWQIRYLSQRPVCLECAAIGEAQKGGRRPVYEPSQEEIAAECKKIREDDTEEQLKKRAGMIVAPYSVPELHVSPAVADWLNERRIGRHGGY